MRPWPQRRRPREQYQDAVATYVAAGGDESVQRVITAVVLPEPQARPVVHPAARRPRPLPRRVVGARRLADVRAARRSPRASSPTLTNVAASSMTHRLDKMTERGPGPAPPRPEPTAPASSSRSPTTGWELFEAAVREANVVESRRAGRAQREERDQLAALLEVVISGLDDVETA